MAAHLRDLPRCPCGRAATVELRTTFNDPQGVYCAPCGKRALKVRLAHDAAMRAKEQS